MSAVPAVTGPMGIETRGKYAAKRCAVDATGERVALWSPRNHVGDPPTVSRADAERLARKIRELDVCAEPPQEATP